MLIVRYADNNGEIKEINVSSKNAFYVYKNAKRMYLHADLILVANDKEFCLM